MSYVHTVPPLPDYALERLGRRNLSRQERQNLAKMIKRRKRMLRQARLEEERQMLHAIVPEEPTVLS